MTQNSSPVVTTPYSANLRILTESPVVQKALTQAQDEHQLRIDQQIMLTETSAAPFHEQARGKLFAQLLEQTGICPVEIDNVGNVIGRIKGSGGPVLVIGAHLDTVFPEDTPIKVRREGSTYYAPGISDDAAGLASLLQLARCLKTQGIETCGDIVIVGTVGEEGNGDLRGSKALWNRPNDYDGMLAIDSAAPTRLLKGGVGSKRFRITFEGPGGHSLHKFGIVGSAIHGICRLVNKIDSVKVPQEPRCTFNVGVIQGGTSVNAIAAKAEIELDIRSTDQASLENFVATILALVDEAVQEENTYWHLNESGKLTASVEKIGDRPAGVNPDDSPVLQAAYGAMQILDIPLVKYAFGATDQNVPLSRSIPATTLGAGGSEDFNHSVKESWCSDKAYLGPQLTLLTALTLVGVKDLTPALLPVIER